MPTNGIGTSHPASRLKAGRIVAWPLPLGGRPAFGFPDSERATITER